MAPKIRDPGATFGNAVERVVSRRAGAADGSIGLSRLQGCQCRRSPSDVPHIPPGSALPHSPRAEAVPGVVPPRAVLASAPRSGATDAVLRGAAVDGIRREVLPEPASDDIRPAVPRAVGAGGNGRRRDSAVAARSPGAAHSGGSAAGARSAGHSRSPAGPAHRSAHPNPARRSVPRRSRRERPHMRWPPWRWLGFWLS